MKTFNAQHSTLNIQTRTFRVLLLLPLLALLTAGATSCRITDGLFTKTVTTVPPAIVGTNIITREIPAQTNALTGVITPSQKLLLPEIVYGPTTYVTNETVNPLAETGVRAVGALPFPFAGTASLVLMWGLHAWKHIRDRMALRAVVEGIDTGRQILQETPEGQALDKKLKDALIQHQEAAGVVNVVSKFVNEYTGNTVK